MTVVFLIFLAMMAIIFWVTYLLLGSMPGIFLVCLLVGVVTYFKKER